MEMIYSRELGISVVSDKPPSGASNDIHIKDALVLYQRLKGTGKTKLFFEGSERSIHYLIECVGHDNINGLEPADAGRFRDFLFDRGMSSSSVKRVFSSVRAIMNLAIKEHGLAMTNVFNGTFIPEDNKRKERLPVPNDVIRRIQRECRSLNDEPRWLIALISDTGMRLSEACGLLASDIVLDKDIPYISLTEHPWRRLKTSSSTRSIPLVGASLWAAKEIKVKGTEFAFPKYCNTQKCNANSASAALNKWLKPRLPEGCVIHSFRHSLRDRLRAVECPSDIVDAIGGWATEGIGQRYGKGYDLNVKAKWMKEMVY
jgi:integrase